MNAEPNHYRSLNLKADATNDEIRRAYHRRVKDCHPDATGRQDETDAFRAAREAYEVLGNPEKRRAYDERGRRAERETASPPPGASPFAAPGWSGNVSAGIGADIELILSEKEAQAGGRFRIPLDGGGCPFCGSFGDFFGGVCPFCGTSRSDLVLDLRPGVADGALYRLSGGRGGQIVRVLVSVRPR
jgi:DnaJ-class molecular chaperone